MSSENVFQRIRNHHAREVSTAVGKFLWRFETLKSDYQDLTEIYNHSLPEPAGSPRNEEARNYVFEVERKLHHYLSGLYTLLQIHNTIQDGVGEEYRSELSDVEDTYRGEPSSRTLLGLRHYVQHENVLMLEPYSSSLDDSSDLVLVLQKLHMSEEYQDGFNAHYGHIEEPYIRPISVIEDNREDLQRFFSETTVVISKHTSEELEDLEQAEEEVARLREDLWDELID
ncbi:hypothetical protein [Halosimplex amylolyticum]|uniref:hypothetical protein n=1 Tax=Halosimplex amylolyticum TaxID=3396616 RepID=UPI003F57CBA3